MEIPKAATKWVLGGGGVVGVGTLVGVLWQAVGAAEGRVTAQHREDIAQIRVEENRKDDRIYSEIKAMRERLEVLADRLPARRRNHE